MPSFFERWLNIFARPDFLTILLICEKNLPRNYRFDQLVADRHYLHPGILAEQHGALAGRPAA